jgi:hypothetical protein
MASSTLAPCRPGQGLLVRTTDIHDRRIGRRKDEVSRLFIAHDEPAAPANLDELAAAHDEAIHKGGHLQATNSK